MEAVPEAKVGYSEATVKTMESLYGGYGQTGEMSPARTYSIPMLKANQDAEIRPSGSYTNITETFVISLCSRVRIIRYNVGDSFEK